MTEPDAETPVYRCDCGRTFPSHLARAAHAGGCAEAAEADYDREGGHA